MRKFWCLACWLFTTLLSVHVRAQLPAPPPLQKVLVPLIIEQTPGRFGADWRTELTVSNGAPAPVVFSWGSPFCLITTGCDGDFVTIPPNSAFRVAGSNAAQNPGAIFVLEEEHASQVQFFLRVWDDSRMNGSWGTEVPVIRDPDFLTSPVELTGAPTDSRYRLTLRIYEPIPTNAAEVRVLIDDQIASEQGKPAVTLVDSVLPLRGGTDPTREPLYPEKPAYAEIGDLVAAFPQLVTASRLRVRIQPLTEGLRYWAFVSITNNETQQITVITPQ